MSNIDREIREKLLHLLYDSSQNHRTTRSVAKKRVSDVSESLIDQNIFYLEEKGLIEIMRSGSIWVFAELTPSGVNVAFAYSKKGEGEEIILYEGKSGTKNLVLTNKRLLSINKIEIEEEIRVENIAEAYLDETTLANPIQTYTASQCVIRINLKDGSKKKFILTSSGLGQTGRLLGLGNLNPSRTLGDRYVNAINKAIILSATSSISDKNFCRYCGATLPSDSIFCEKCGKKIK